jgi:proteasome alpha subunit
MAYDRAITVFSPDGRLFQVEYAREAVKRGTTTIGVKFNTGVVLIADKRSSSKLVEPESIEKIFTIDERIGCASSGLVADARVLVDKARVEAQINKVTYGEAITIPSIVKKICDLMQSYTQYGGVRPFGTALLIGGIDSKGPHLYETDPSGALTAYKAASIGAGREAVVKFFEEEYKEGMNAEEAIALGLKAMSKSMEKPDLSAVEVCVITQDGKMCKMTPDEMQKYIKGKK